MRITTKGQVTIPEPIRRRSGLLPGTEVEFTYERGKVVLRPIDGKGASKREREISEHLERLRGIAKGRWTTEAVMRLTRGDD